MRHGLPTAPLAKGTGKKWLGSEHKAKASLGPKDQGTLLSGPGHSPIGRGSSSMPESCPESQATSIPRRLPKEELTCRLYTPQLGGRSLLDGWELTRSYQGRKGKHWLLCPPMTGEHFGGVATAQHITHPNTCDRPLSLFQTHTLGGIPAGQGWQLLARAWGGEGGWSPGGGLEAEASHHLLTESAH